MTVAMTVKELMNYIKALPEDMPVAIAGAGRLDRVPVVAMTRERLRRTHHRPFDPIGALEVLDGLGDRVVHVVVADVVTDFADVVADAGASTEAEWLVLWHAKMEHG